MATSKVGICNMALAHIGQTSISSIDEASEGAIQCKLHYDNALDCALREHAWNFATRRVVLAVSPVEPPDEWEYAYNVPSDMVKAREIVVASGVPAAPFAIEAVPSGSGLVLYTNIETAELKYTARITETTFFDPLFIRAFSWALAADIVMPITRDLKIFQMATNMFVNLSGQAKAADANEGQAEEPPDASWIEVRGLASEVPAARIVR
jgi:hypothetical protein